MIDGNVCDAAVPAQEVSALSVDVHHWKYFIIFKGVETPPFFWDTCFRGLAVFNNYTPKGVSVLKKCPRKFEAWLLFNRHLFVLAVASRSRPRQRVLRRITASTNFILLAVLAAPGIVKLPLGFLSLQVLSISITSLRLPAARPLARASPLVGMAAVPVSVTVPSSLVFLSCGFSVWPILPASPRMILTFLKFEQIQESKGSSRSLNRAAFEKSFVIWCSEQNVPQK